VRREGSILQAVYLSSEELPGRATARGVLRYVCDTRGMPHRDADEMLEVVGLDQAATKRIRTFSMAMKQRLDLAVALLPRTRALMLDEPLNGLDPDGIHWIRHHRALSAHGLAFTESGRALVVSGATTPKVGRIVFETGLDVLHLQTVSRSLEETYFGRLAKSGDQA